eukprot:gene347-biopygen9010
MPIPRDRHDVSNDQAYLAYFLSKPCLQTKAISDRHTIHLLIVYLPINTAETNGWLLNLRGSFCSSGRLSSEVAHSTR